MKKESLISDLKKSPLFNLSLSSKELFHSNFIAWICEKYPIKFGEILCKYLDVNLNPSKRDIIEVSREEKQIDLIIKFESKRIIIENKVKSIPNQTQLINYRKKFSSEDIFVLLTLIPPNFEIKKSEWKILTYKDLMLMLIELKDSLNINDNYSFFLLDDYIEFIRNLEEIISAFSLNIGSEVYDYYSSDYSLFKQIRLHDLYIKYKYNQIVIEIYNYLKYRLKDISIFKGIRTPYEKTDSQVYVSFNMVRGKGVINIECSKENEIAYGIMLDGVKYNHYMYAWGKTSDKRYEIANELRLKNEWFQFDSISDDNTYPKKDKDFNKFNSMIYRSFKISTKTKLRELLERICNDTIKMMQINAIH